MLQFGYNTGVINAPETVIERFIRFAYRQRYDGENMTYKASTFLYAIAVAVFALGMISHTRNIRYKKPVIRNAKWTSPNSVSCKEQTSPFSLETSQFFES